MSKKVVWEKPVRSGIITFSEEIPTKKDIAPINKSKTKNYFKNGYC